MKKLFQILGGFFLVIGVLFFLVHSFVATGSPDEDFARDLLGFPIPHPPLWTSYIPFVGGLLMFAFEFFSIHGLVGLAISGVLLYLGGLLISLGNRNDNK